jgi:hypothetical protein
LFKATQDPSSTTEHFSMLCTGATVSNEAEIIDKIQTWLGRDDDVNFNLGV